MKRAWRIPNKVLKSMYNTCIIYTNDFTHEDLEAECPWIIDMAEFYNEVVRTEELEEFELLKIH